MGLSDEILNQIAFFIQKRRRINEYFELCIEHGCQPDLKAFNELYSAELDLIFLNGIERTNLQRITGNYYEAIVHNEDFMHHFRNLAFYGFLGKINPELDYISTHIDQYLHEEITNEEPLSREEEGRKLVLVLKRIAGIKSSTQ